LSQHGSWPTSAIPPASEPSPPTGISSPAHPEGLIEIAAHAAEIHAKTLHIEKLNERDVLEYVPSSFKVIQHLCPKLSCRSCETIVQAPMPALPIERGRPGPGTRIDGQMQRFKSSDQAQPLLSAHAMVLGVRLCLRGQTSSPPASAW
jgi:hypothetical protein